MSEEIPFRTVTTNVGPDVSPSRGMNTISTTKYTWYTWLPKSIWEQFRRIANIYFLLISILMLIGTYATYLFVSPLDPFSTVMTLLFVLLVTSLKEGSEDLQRYRSDQFENTREVTVVNFRPDGSMIETVKKSQDLNPGDIIKLVGHKVVPADFILIYTSIYDDGNKCYIETANIDGETNLKVREAPPMLLTHFNHIISKGEAKPDLFQGSAEIEIPNKNIHRFIGTLSLDKSPEKIPLGAENVILRGSVVSNTEWVYGIVVYTGQETKLQMNSRHAPSKMSQLEKNLNLAIIVIFVAQVILVTISVISIYIMGYNDKDKLPYVFPKDDDNSSILPLWLEQWFVFFLLYNNFIPISLYVTIELVNVGQSYLTSSDEHMYNADLDVACSVRASNLLQELGMVSNIFSDKTGTLTRNEMKLKKFVINNRLYDVKVVSNTGDDAAFSNSNPMVDNYAEFGSNKQMFAEFCRCLTTCHTVVREKNGSYRAESPDELALVEGVAGYRCGLVERGSKEMIVNLLGERKTFEILAVNPFNATRKRMSILVRDPSNNEYILMCKGADNIMIPLCQLSTGDISNINKSLLDLANMGLRTLIVASKVLTAAEANNWLAKFKQASLSTVNREECIMEAAAEVEQGMKLLGITGIEDRLQDEVPECIAEFAKAGITLWMLTGDKLETAINIGHSCNLLLHDTKVLMLTNIHSEEAFKAKLNEEHHKLELFTMNGSTSPPSRESAVRRSSSSNNNQTDRASLTISNDAEKKDFNIALVIDGPSFTFFDPKDDQQREQLLIIGKNVRSVIACRLTPTQKRELVHLVKTGFTPKATCLSIGDGANDVSMILEADVGVGIFGKEGRQAANNADFAIGEFKFLRRLVLLHGRYNYVRQSSVFLYSMHKNMVLTLTLFWFSYYTAVSGTSLYQSWIYSGFNFILGLPIIFYGIMDRDLTADFVLQHPQVYSTSRSNKLLTLQAIGTWILNAVFYAIIICLCAYVILTPTFRDHDLYTAGTIVFVGMTMSLQCKVAFFHNQWSYPHFLSMGISILGMFLYFLLIAAASWDYYNVADRTFRLGIYWYYGIFTIPLVVIFIDWLVYFVQMLLYPTDEMLFREVNLPEKFNNFQMADFFSPENVGNNKIGDSSNNNDYHQANGGHVDHEQGGVDHGNHSPRPLSLKNADSGKGKPITVEMQNTSNKRMHSSHANI